MMKVKQGGAWVNVGGEASFFGAGLVDTYLRGMDIEVTGELKVKVPDTKTEINRMFAGWKLDKMPIIEHKGQVLNMGYLFVDAELANIDFSKLDLRGVTNINDMLQNVVAKEGLDLRPLDFVAVGKDSQPFRNIKATDIKIPKLYDANMNIGTYLIGLRNAGGSVPRLGVHPSDYAMAEMYKNAYKLTDEDIILYKY